MNGGIVSVLWADDEIDGFLSPIAWYVGRQPGINLVKSKNLADSLPLLAALKEGGGRCGLIVDIILPRQVSGAALELYQGLKLAEEAAHIKIEFIAFVTVVPMGEVLDRYQELQRRFPDSYFIYIYKQSLLDARRLDQIIAGLKGSD